MEKLIIQGGNRLEGRVRVSSAKNAVLPIIAGTLLASTPSKLLEIPNLEDVGTICQVIESLGVKITRNKADDEIIFDASTLTATEAPYELVRKMRASFLVMGPLLARKGEAKISMPGFDAAINAVQSGQADGIIAGMSVTDARKETFDFSDSY